ncbi:MAG TPA: hypothetical protein VII52_04320 [Gemmatimonadaceae bacterium]
MRRLGLGLLWLGAGIGSATCVGLVLGLHPSGWSWITMVGFAKLAAASSLGVMAGGAVVLRLHNRQLQRRLVADDRDARQTPLP